MGLAAARPMIVAITVMVKRMMDSTCSVIEASVWSFDCIRFGDGNKISLNLNVDVVKCECLRGITKVLG